MAIYNYDPNVDKPIFDEKGKVLTKIPTSKATQIYNADGDRLSKTTLLIPQKSGFGNAENAKKINKAGRPKGSKSKTKSTLNQAIALFETYQIEAAEKIVAVMMGDEEKAGFEIKASDMMSASKYIIEAPRKMDKDRPQPKEITSEEDTPDVAKPLISLTVNEHKGV